MWIWWLQTWEHRRPLWGLLISWRWETIISFSVLWCKTRFILFYRFSNFEQKVCFVHFFLCLLFFQFALIISCFKITLLQFRWILNSKQNYIEMNHEKAINEDYHLPFFTPIESKFMNLNEGTWYSYLLWCMYSISHWRAKRSIKSHAKSHFIVNHWDIMASSQQVSVCL